MLSHQSSILRRTLPLAMFNQLRLALEQMAQRVGEGALLLTEDLVVSAEIPQGMLAERFTVLLSEQFNALLLGTALEQEVLEWQQPQGISYEVGLTFAPEAIATFVDQLSNLLKNTPLAFQTLHPNDVSLQSEFTLSLLEILSAQATEDPTQTTVYPSVSVCQPLQEALRHEVEQEILLNQVTSQIRQTLELPAILTTAVEQVRSFLQADRLVIYQFEELGTWVTEENIEPNSSLHRLITPKGWGQITYEARASAAIPSTIDFSEDCCFVDLPNCQEKYRKGFVLAVEDVETAYVFSQCLLRLMRRFRIRAKLVVPIVIHETLWGLLIAHQCFAPRQWQESEKRLLLHIAEHLAIAIYQAQLYAQLQQQKQTLEQRVIDRTQELHDALLAAQSASRAKTEFLSIMSHELRTPLTCVIGLSATLLRWPLGQLTQKQRDYLQTIQDNGEHLLELINDILDLSQLEAGKTVLNINEFSLSQLAYDSLQVLKDKAASQNVDLGMTLNIEPSQDRFRADPWRVKQILVNLLSNAIKFTPEGGRVFFRIWTEGKTAVFQVEDTGIGISEHQQHLLFQKFQQLDSSYRRQYEGTGLGLALTKQLVDLHGGRIEVESTVNVGSIFTVWIPCALSVDESSNPTRSIFYEAPQGRIVLVADHEENATLICDILTAAGYHIVWIIQGSTAVKQIEILQPFIVIVDLQYSSRNGYEVMRELRQLPTTQDLKILVLTKTKMPQEQLNKLLLEANDYLTQPIKPEQLLRKIEGLIRP